MSHNLLYKKTKSLHQPIVFSGNLNEPTRAYVDNLASAFDYQLAYNLQRKENTVLQDRYLKEKENKNSSGAFEYLEEKYIEAKLADMKVMPFNIENYDLYAQKDHQVSLQKREEFKKIYANKESIFNALASQVEKEFKEYLQTKRSATDLNSFSPFKTLYYFSELDYEDIPRYSWLHTEYEKEISKIRHTPDLFTQKNEQVYQRMQTCYQQIKARAKADYKDKTSKELEEIIYMQYLPTLYHLLLEQASLCFLHGRSQSFVSHQKEFSGRPFSSTGKEFIKGCLHIFELKHLKEKIHEKCEREMPLIIHKEIAKTSGRKQAFASSYGKLERDCFRLINRVLSEEISKHYYPASLHKLVQLFPEKDRAEILCKKHPGYENNQIKYSIISFVVRSYAYKEHKEPTIESAQNGAKEALKKKLKEMH